MRSGWECLAGSKDSEIESFMWFKQLDLND